MEPYRKIDFLNESFTGQDQDSIDIPWETQQKHTDANALSAIQIPHGMRPAHEVKNSSKSRLKQVEESIRKSKLFRPIGKTINHKSASQDTGRVLGSGLTYKNSNELITDMDYYEAIRTDNAFWLDAILQNASTAERHVLLNGVFSYSNLDSVITLNKGFPFHRETSILVLAKPFCVAAVYGSRNAMIVMLDYGVDVYQTDTHGFNVVHCLIAASFFDRTREPDMKNMFLALKNILPKDKMTNLLKMENSGGIRPLEFAAQHATFLMMKEVFDTGPIYLVKTISNGPLTVKYYDITEYEYGGDRVHKSPILSIAHIEESMIPLDSVADTITSPTSIFKVWIERKMRYNMPLVIMWFTLRLWFTVILFINHNHDWKNFTFVQQYLPVNSTKFPLCQPYMFIPISLETKIFFSIYLILHASVIIVLAIFEYFYHKKKYKHLLASKLYKNKARFKFYRACQVILAVCTIFSLYWSNSTFIFNIGFILLYTVSIWSLLYFVQLIPSVGHFVIIIQHMFKDFFHFFLIFILLFLPFPHALFRILNESSPCLDLSNMLRFYYNTVTIMLNMVDFHDIVGKVSDPLGLMVTHILFVFVVSILLINFLVALFSASVAAVTSQKNVVVPIQRLSIIIPLEKREILKYVLFPYYRAMQRRCFSVKRGRVYLVQRIVSYSQSSK